MSQEYVLAPSLQQQFFDKTTGELLANGEVWFYRDKARTELKPVYQITGTPPNYTFTPLPNPLNLSSIGTWTDGVNDIAVYYQIIDPDTNEKDPYFIEVYAAPGKTDLQFTREAYPDSSTSTPDIDTEENFVTNGQFSHVIPFNTPTQEKGLITEDTTQVNQAWFFDLTTPLDNKVKVTYTPLFNQGLMSNPKNEINIAVEELGSTMNQFDLYQFMGFVNILQGERATLLVCGNSNTASQVSIDVIIEQFYQDGVFEQTTVGQLILPTTPDMVFFDFVMPATIVQAVNPVKNYTKIIFRGPLLQIVDYSMTSIQLQRGANPAPIYLEQPQDLEDAKTFASDFDFPTDNITQKGEADYEYMRYFNDGYNWWSPAGKVYEAIFTDEIPADMLVADGSNLLVAGYTNGIPNKRLYDVIGNTFGGAEDLIATSAADLVTIQSSRGARENSPYTQGTTSFTVTQTVVGLQMGVDVVMNGTIPNTVTMTWIDQFAPNPNPYNPAIVTASQLGQAARGDRELNNVVLPSIINTFFDVGLGVSSTFTPPAPPPVLNDYGSKAISVSTSDPGSPVTNAIANITFNTENIALYRTTLGVAGGSPSAASIINFLEFSSVGNSNRGAYFRLFAYGSDRFPAGPQASSMAINFSVDGSHGELAAADNVALTVDFLTAKSLEDNILKFILDVANPFEWTVLVDALPAAGQYFLYSSATVDYYAWFTIDAVGVDPLVPARTGVQIDLLSTDTTTEAAEKIATAISSTTFSLPDQADFIALGHPKLKWGVHL